MSKIVLKVRDILRDMFALFPSDIITTETFQFMIGSQKKHTAAVL
jgi:hypothetical protein